MRQPRRWTKVDDDGGVGSGHARDREVAEMVEGHRAEEGEGDVDDGGDNDVYWDDVDGSFGYAWELGEQSAGVADDDRLGHAKAADPTWARLLQRRLNN